MSHYKFKKQATLKTATNNMSKKIKHFRLEETDNKKIKLFTVYKISGKRFIANTNLSLLSRLHVKIYWSMLEPRFKNSFDISKKNYMDVFRPSVYRKWCINEYKNGPRNL